MWVPDITFRPSAVFVLVLLALHICVLVAIWMLPAAFLLLLPLWVGSLGVTVAKRGLLLLDRSVLRVWLGADGWYIRTRNCQEQGPLHLSGRSHLDSYFIRLSLKAEGGRVRHLLVTPGMVGKDVFRKLQVFLRWAPQKNQVAID